ncbi:uncharacterized protein TNCV_4196321 [Trichonephila clavipes]|nr:uncharacterized protein TNCV_4196321 [Trichonephila clavipes]
MADVLSRNPVESMVGEQVNCAIIRDLVLSSREQLVEEQRKDPELGHMYRYLENPDDTSVNAKIRIIHVKTVVYRPQANRTERVNRDLVQKMANYVNDQHDTWDQFLREFASKVYYTFSEISDGIGWNWFCSRRYFEKWFDEARRNTKAKHEKWAKYYDRRRRDVQIKVNDWVLVKTHPLSSAAQKGVAKFKPKFEGPYRVLEVKRNNLVVWRAGKRLTVNVDQVRLYHHRKSDEKEIRTSSSDSNSSRCKSSF